MEGRAKLLGHSLHPMLIVFPLGLLGGAVIFEIVYYVTENPMYAVVTYWMIVSGLIGGLVAGLFGFIDWSAIPAGTRAKSVGLMHAGANVLVLLLFAGSWFLRSGPSYQLGVAVHEGANVNAPSSLVTENARPRKTELRNV
jgi:uncharacterized membrane protein